MFEVIGIMFEVIGIFILIVIVWSFGEAILGMIFPEYGLKLAKKRYIKMPNSETKQSVEEYEWKVRRKRSSL